jgi:hypothetical protein
MGVEAGSGCRQSSLAPGSMPLALFVLFVVSIVMLPAIFEQADFYKVCCGIILAVDIRGLTFSPCIGASVSATPTFR